MVNKLLLNEKWSNLIVNSSKAYSFKAFFTDDSFELMILDLDSLKLYSTKQTHKEISKLSNELNKSLEAPLTKILKHLEECLHSTANDSMAKFTNSNDSVTSNLLTLECNSKLAGFKFKWIFKLNQLESNETLKEHFIIPLLYNLAEHQSRENELLKIIQSKDKEIDDYRAQGFKLTRKYLATEVFSKDSFNDYMTKRTTNNDSSLSEIKKRPELCLHTDLADTVSKSSFQKYFSFEPKHQQEEQQQQKQQQNNDDKEEEKASNESQSNQQETPLTPSQKSRVKERQEELLEEAKRNERKLLNQQKKKKLF